MADDKKIAAPVKPAVAAKELRDLSRQLLELSAQQVGPAGKLAIPRNTREHAEIARRHWVAVSTHDTYIAQDLVTLRSVAKTRRTSEIEASVARIEQHIKDRNKVVHETWIYVNSILDTINAAAVKKNAVNVPALQDISDRINHLVQQLPTVDDLPQTPAENVLCAIVAVLRHSEIENTKDLKWKEVLNGKAQNGDASTNGETVVPGEILAEAIGG